MRNARLFAVALSGVLCLSAVTGARAADADLPKDVAALVEQVDQDALDMVELLLIVAEPEPLGVTPQEVLDFFNEAVAERRLFGRPPILGLLTMQFVLQSAVTAYEEEQMGETFFWLLVAFVGSDGFEWPVEDVVYGPACGELNSMIFDAMLTLLIPGGMAVPAPGSQAGPLPGQTTGSGTVGGTSLTLSPATALQPAR